MIPFKRVSGSLFVKHRLLINLSITDQEKQFEAYQLINFFIDICCLVLFANNVRSFLIKAEILTNMAQL